VELKVSFFVPPHNPGVVLLSELGQVLATRSGGRLTLRIFHSEQLGGTAEHYELARSGKVDIAYMIHSATPGRFPLTELAALPPVGDALAGTLALESLTDRYLQPEHAGVKLLFLTANSPMAVHSAKPLRSLVELKGKRVGHTGRVIAATLEALGAVPVTVLPLQVCAAMAEGRIDATTMTFEAALVVRLADVARHSYELNANTITFALVMNEQRHSDLAPDLRALLDDVLGASAGRMLAGRLAQAAEEGRTYMREAGVKIVTPDPRDRSRLDAAFGPMVDDFIMARARENLPARLVYDALKEKTA